MGRCKVRVEDHPLIKAISDARRRYRFAGAAAEQLVDDFTKPSPALRGWIFELCDPSPRASPFTTDDDLAAFARDISGQNCSARWVERLVCRIKRFVQDKRRLWMGAGRPQNIDRALILYVIRLIEERTGVEFRFWQHWRPAAFDEDGPSPPLNSSGGPMLRLAAAALFRLFQIDDRTSGYLGLVSPARHYKRDEIARTAKLARRASRASPMSPAKWSSDWILAFRSDVRVELAGKGRQENEDQRSASPSSWDMALKALVANPWVNLREALEAAAAGERQTCSGLDVLQVNLKNGVQPNLIEVAKRMIIRAGLFSPMSLVAERTLPEPPTSPPPPTGRTA
jgi:hypothetical protein